MSQPLRQSSLLAAEDYLKVFQSFKEINFTKYDFDGIRASMLAYVQKHYPEDFNDYVESSELIVIIDLLAYLTTSLSMRTDLNSRENFLDTAERRESVVRLAQMLSYNAKRNLPAAGLMRIKAVSTSETIYDSRGRNIADTTIYWDDPSNIDAIEQFTDVLNGAFSSSNQFGKPVKSGIIATAQTSLYSINTAPSTLNTYSINLTINNESLPFNVVNPDFVDNGFFFERHPDPADLFHLIHVNDGQGVGSINNGFFVQIKQGELKSETFNFADPVPNRILELGANNVNEQDVYFQEIDQAGNVIEAWTKVPTDLGSNIVYNDIDLSNRKIYSEITKLKDNVDLKFSDGIYGEIPKGLYRAWYRTSANKNIVVRPENASNINLSIDYIGKDLLNHTLVLSVSLEHTITNSAPSESTEEIKRRAPQVYYAQNRMVNAEDYNVFPLNRGNEIEKIHAVNRTYAGHSRYIDINDPTGSTQSLDLTADDGTIYIDNNSKPSQTFNIKRNITDNTVDLLGIRDLFANQMAPFINNFRLRNFYYLSYSAHSDVTVSIDNAGSDEPVKWETKPILSANNTGFIYAGSLSAPSVLTNVNSNNGGNHLHVGTALTFVDPNNDSNRMFTNIVSINRNGLPSSRETNGPVTLSQAVPRGWVLDKIIPTVNLDLAYVMDDIAYDDDNLIQKIYSTNGVTESTETLGISIITAIKDKKTFGMYLDYSTGVTEGVWTYYAGALSSTASWDENIDSRKWLVLFKTIDDNTYEVTTRGDKMVFESFKQCRFFFDPDNLAIDVYTGRAVHDQIYITEQNTAPSPSETWTMTIPDADDYVGIPDAPDPVCEMVNMNHYSTPAPHPFWTAAGGLIEENAIVDHLGRMTASKLTSNSGVGYGYTLGCEPFAPATPYTGSFYVKAGNTSIVQIGLIGSAFAFNRVKYDLSTGNVVGQDGTGFTHSLTSVGNGWWRIAMTATTTSAGIDTSTQPVIYWGENTGDYIFVQGVQIEAGSIATELVESSGGPGLLCTVPETPPVITVQAPSVIWRNAQMAIPNIIVLKNRTDTYGVTIEKPPILDVLQLEIRNGYIEITNPEAITTAMDGAEVKLIYTDGLPLKTDLKFQVIDQYITSDGFVDQARVEITPLDFNKDGAAENPLAFDDFVSPDSYNIFHHYTDYQGYVRERIWKTGIIHVDNQADVISNLNSASAEYYNQPIGSVGLIFVQSETWLHDLVTTIEHIVDLSDQFQVARLFEQKVVYVADTDTFFSLNLIKPFVRVEHGVPQQYYIETDKFSRKRSRTFGVNTFSTEHNPLHFRWKHYAPIDHRIDPSPSNIIDMFLLTSGFNNEVKLWKKRGESLLTFPRYPTIKELSSQFSELTEKNMVSDEIIFRPAKFKILFGNNARREFQASFKVVKIPNAEISDNEIKTAVVQAIEEYFDISVWNFGERFYYTELAAYIHAKLAAKIATVVIVPDKEDAKFGEMFQVKAESNELFLSTASVDNVEIVNDLTQSNMKVKI